MNLSLTLLSLSEFLYFAAFVFYLAAFSGKLEQGSRPAFALLRVGFLLVTFYFFSGGIDAATFVPVSSVSQVMAFFAWSIAFVYLVLFIRIQSESFGLVLTPILLIFNGAACLTYHLPSNEVPAAANPYFTLHIISAFFAYACFALSFSAGILYLIQQHELKKKNAGAFYAKLPSLDELDELIFQPMIWGAVLLTTAVGIGFMWSKTAYGEFWLADPKTIATAVTIALYGLILFSHYILARRGKRVVVMSLFAFGMVLISFIGTRFISGSHNFLQ